MQGQASKQVELSYAFCYNYKMYYKKPVSKHRAKTQRRFTNDKEKKIKPLFKKPLTTKKNSKKKKLKNYKIIRNQLTKW